MYCRHCGQPIPVDPTFCPRCGQPQGAQPAPVQGGINSAWIILAFIVFPPLGYILMWTSSHWSSAVKWAI